jgi:peroxiredoxin
MPNVVAAYNAYKDKGFGIIGVSLDNNVDKWKDAITNLNITWPQMSDLKGWENEAAKLYGVNSIPATVLVNREGIIVARNLRGEAIAEKLAELLK